MMAKEPSVDAKRMGAVGASYGGYSIFYLAGVHQGRFKAFIAHCGVFNFESEYGATEELWFPNKDYGGPYWKNLPSYKFSPHLMVDKWTTPILIITGANDFRIPYTQSMEAFTAAQLHGVPSRLLFFEDECHWVTKPQNSVIWQREFFEWLDTYLK
jgi:dipeptidyl aminopeptidase/acylaminoacyl peptidase